MFTQKPLVTLEVIETALRGTWDSEELNPIFFDHNESIIIRILALIIISICLCRKTRAWK